MAKVIAHPTDNQAEYSSTAMNAVLRIAEKWQISDNSLSTLMGGISVPTLQRWRRQLRTAHAIRGELSRDQLDRASYLLGIYKALHILFPDENQADSWIHRPVNLPGFDGRPALELMLAGGMDDLQHIRRFLDGWRS